MTKKDRTIGDVVDRELASLRREQAAAVMEEIGPLLDAWEAMPGDVKSQLEEDALDFCHYMRRIYLAIDTEGKQT
jgi:hypothetical protein